MSAPSSVRIDHAVVGVRDLDAAVARFESEYGLPPLLTSDHPEWGTRNAVVAVGPGQFIELLAVADPEARTPLVRGLQHLLVDGDRMVGLCLRPPDLDATAARLGVRVIDGERHEPNRLLTFRRTVPEERPGLPFFIHWHGDQDELDERYAAPGGEITWAEFGGDAAELRTWIGDDHTRVRAIAGRPGPRRFAVRTARGDEIILE